MTWSLDCRWISEEVSDVLYWIARAIIENRLPYLMAGEFELSI